MRLSIVVLLLCVSVAPAAAQDTNHAAVLDDLSAETLTALERYRRGRLLRAPLQARPTGSEFAVVLSWAPFDGAGAPLGTEEFATRVGDTATLDRLVDERRRIDGGLAVGVAVGASLAAVGAVVVGEVTETPGPRIQQFPTAEGDGFDLEAFAAAEADHAEFVRPRLILGSILLAVGIDAVFLSFVPWDRGRRKQQYAFEYYTPDDLDGWIESHNEGLRAHLGLSVEEARKIDIIEGLRAREAAGRTGFRLVPMLGPVFGIAGRF